MRFSISRRRLWAALQGAGRAVSPVNPCPVLTGVLLEVNAAGAVVTGCSAGLRIRSELPAGSSECLNIQAAGMMVVPAKPFMDLVRCLPEGLLTVETGSADSCRMTIRTGGGLYRLSGMKPDEFPASPQLDRQTEVAFEAGVLRQLIQQVVFAVSSAENRPVLTGVLFSRDPAGRLRLVATDGVKLAAASAQPDMGSLPPDSSWILPGRSMLELSRLLGSGEGEVQLVFGEQGMAVRFHHTTLYSAFIEGTYPKVEGLLTGESRTEIRTAVLPLLEAVERACLWTGAAGVVRLCSRNGRFELQSASAEVGDVKEVLEMESSRGEEVTVSFNGRYMRDMLRAVHSSSVTMKFAGSSGPLRLEPCGEWNAVCMLTPVRTHA